MENKREIQFFRNLCQFIALIVLINPVTLYLLLKNGLYTIILFSIAAGGYISISRHPLLSRIKLYYFNLLLLVSIAYHMELIFTINFPERVIPNIYQIQHNYYFNKPNLTEQFTDPEYNTLYLTNQQGYRIDEHTNTNLEIHTCDWLFIGDSYTQGAQVNYQELFTTQLYPHFPDKIIVNAGISGYSIVDEYNYYIQEGYKLNPQKVFLQLCIFNDFMQVTESKIGFSEYLMQYSNLYRYIKYNSLYANPEELSLKRFTEPFYPTEQENKEYNIFYLPSSENKEKDIQNLTEYLRKFKEATSKYGAELCILLIPTKEQVSFSHFTEVIETFQIDVAKLDMLYPNKLIAKLSGEIGFEVIDLYDKLNDGEGLPFFPQDEHLNTTGHKKVAEAITAHFKNEANKYTYISQENTSDRYPTYLPNEQSVLYQTLTSGFFQVALLDSSFNNHPLFPFSTNHRIHPVQSPDGKWIAYTEGDQEAGHTNVILYHTRTQLFQPVTYVENEYGAIPAFSPAGNILVYPSWKQEKGYFTNPVLVLYDIETGNKQTLTEDTYESWRPVFHPTEPLLFFISKEYQDHFTIVALHLLTNEKEIIIQESFNIWDPAISPDGNWLLFAGYKDENWDLFLYNLREKHHHQLTHTKGDEWDPTFGTDEKDIWFGGVFGLNNGLYHLKR